MTNISYVGLPDSLTIDEEATKKILDYRLNDVINRFDGKGNLREIKELRVILERGVEGNFTAQEKHGKDHELSSLYFVASNPTFSLDQVILPENTKNDILEALNLLRYQQLIFEDWGFKQIEPNYKVALNFFGPPGTGKTMAAHAIAHHLGKKILAVDYAQIESKFVGDAPKNLEKAFKVAAEENALLFFDEADSFLGKRIAGISTGSEQAINSLRSQMLLALDRHTGVVIFASNFVENYDKAFETRIRHIQFELPDKSAIEKIFKCMLPSNAPIEEINFEEVSGEANGFSGRDIKNSLLLAAIKAATQHDACRITQSMVLDAVKTTKSSLTTFQKGGIKIQPQEDVGKRIKEKLAQKQKRVK
jgi:SpoVK/Ycf46/Vps4 family AAA+-type ATPase